MTLGAHVGHAGATGTPASRDPDRAAYGVGVSLTSGKKDSG